MTKVSSIMSKAKIKDTEIFESVMLGKIKKYINNNVTFSIHTYMNLSTIILMYR